METLSRVKKFEDLRKQIEDNNIGSETLPQEKLQDYAQRLNEIDPSIFKKVAISDEEPYTPERERKVTSSFEENDNTMGEFRNEYLDDFINEVREYNIKKGNRESENTQIDILNQLNAVSRAKRSDYVQTIEDTQEPLTQTAALNRDEIAAQVKSLLEEEPILPRNDVKDAVVLEPIPQVEAQPPVVEPIEVQQSIQEKQPQPSMAHEGKPRLVREPSSQPQKIYAQETIMSEQTDRERTETLQVQMPKNTAAAQPMAPTEEKRHPFVNRKPKPTTVPTKEEQIEIEREKRLHQKLVEETQQLRVQLNEYEDDLNDLSEGVEKTNKMLNIILGCLILALLVIIGIIIYWIVQAGGLV